MFQTALKIEACGARLEDRAEVISTSSGVVIAVADGVGGRSGAAAAAEMIVSRTRMATEPPPPDPIDAQFWCALLAKIDIAVGADAIAGESTAVLLHASDYGITGASVGDSAAWLITPTEHIDLTIAQHRKPRVGAGAMPIPFRAPPLKSDATLLIATDGLFKYARAGQICEAAREADLETAATRLIELVRLKSGALHDDIAVVLCRANK